MGKPLSNIHPGEILLEEFLRPMNLSQNRLARELAVPPRRINEIVLGKRSITPDTALLRALVGRRHCTPAPSPHVAGNVTSSPAIVG